MKLKFTPIKSFCSKFVADLCLKKLALAVLLFFSLTSISKAQNQHDLKLHDDSFVFLDKSAFSVSINHGVDGKLNFELINNQASEITPFFYEVYLKGYNFDESKLEQSMNNMTFNENIERVFGPQFMGLGLNALPAFGRYKTTFTTADTVNETPSIQIRISGRMNGYKIFWSGSYNF